MKYINFNNAGSSFLQSNTINAINNYIKKENRYGGYYTQDIFKNKINQFYKNAAYLINCKPNNISFIQNTTLGWNFLLESINFKKNSNVVIFDNEYGSNLISLIKKKIEIRVSKLKSNGQFCLHDLKKKMDRNTILINACHIASQCGNILDINSLGMFIKKHYPKTYFVIDACQSAGHINLDVKKNYCDALITSGRKYLRGPRGTGFIYLNQNIRKKISPKFLDLSSASIKNKKIEINKNHKIFEVFEFSPALKIGLSKSINNITKLGLRRIEEKNIDLSKRLRKRLENYDIYFLENSEYLSGINTMVLKKFDIENLHSYLLKKGILTSVSSTQTSTLYFKRIKKKKVLRISFHYYNTFTQTNYLADCIISFLKK